MNRRSFLEGVLALPLAAAVSRALAAPHANMEAVKMLQDNWKTLLAEGADVATTAEPLKLSKDEWKKRLEPLAFSVLREEATERPGTSPLNNEKRPGVFVCAGCSLPIFTSEMKYDSGTGWPSFFTMIPGSLATKTDFKLIYPRKEYHCVRCGGHHGHVFEDGPPPTGQRYCNNGAALRFIPKGGKA